MHVGTVVLSIKVLLVNRALYIFRSLFFSHNKPNLFVTIALKGNSSMKINLALQIRLDFARNTPDTNWILTEQSCN